MWDEAAKGFKWEIGQVVAHKGHAEFPMVVVEQVLSRCHGGFQRIYVCASICTAGRQLAPFNESELTEYREPDAGVEDFVARLKKATRKDVAKPDAGSPS